MWRRVFLWLALVAAAATALTALFEALLRRNLYRYRTPARLSVSPEAVGIHYEKVTFWTADGLSLRGWYFPAERPLATVLFLLGTGYGARRLWSSVARARAFGTFLRRLGCNLLVFDYRSPGLNGGTPSEQSTYLDAEAALAYLHARPDVDPMRIVLYGFSLGTAIAVELAARASCAGLVLRAPLTSLREIALVHAPPLGLLFRLMPWLPLTRYDSATKLARLRLPLLVLHGEADESVPLWMGRRLYDLAPGPKRFVTLAGASHHDFPVDEVATAVREFVEGL